jgi:hypothetical protein
MMMIVVCSGTMISPKRFEAMLATIYKTRELAKKLATATYTSPSTWLSTCPV